MNVGSAGRQDAEGVNFGSLSYGGRYVAFPGSDGLADGDRNGVPDVLVRDRKAGTTSLVSVGSAGAQGNAVSGDCRMSRDARRVAFWSRATNLVPNATSGVGQIYLRDRAAGTTVLVSAGPHGEPADDETGTPAISGSGRYVAFGTRAGNLVPGGGGGGYQLYVRDTATGTTTLESVTPAGKPGDGDSFDAAITPDGRWLAFASEADDLVAGDTNGARDVFLRDRQAGRTVMVSVGTGGRAGNADSDASAGWVGLSDDGGLVAFESYASDLVPGDTNGLDDVFVRDVRAGTTERVSLAPGGGQADGGSWGPSLSADGRHVAFSSNATDLVPGDTNGRTDVFVRDLTTGATVRASVSNAGREVRRGGQDATIAADGRSVLFTSFAPNLVPGDTNGRADIFVRRLFPAPP